MNNVTSYEEIPAEAAREVSDAVRALRAGKLVAFPTETVYGLGADARDGRAVAGIFETKGRPSFNPLIVHVANVQAAECLVAFTSAARNLANAFWPGPLTLVLPARANNGISSLVSAGLETLAVRVPAHPIARTLLSTFDGPVAAPSANRSGRVSPTRAAHVRDEFGNAIQLVLDGGASAAGLESTIVDMSGDRPVLLRPGTVSRDQLEQVLAVALYSPDGSVPKRPNAPGQLLSHYAPRAPVKMNATTVEDGDAVIAFGSKDLGAQGPVVNLSPDGDLREAAAGLFDALRTLDRDDVSRIVVVEIPNSGVGEAINDRLRRAAAPRT